jgi:hypothetical protein
MGSTVVRSEGGRSRSTKRRVLSRGVSNGFGADGVQQPTIGSLVLSLKIEEATWRQGVTGLVELQAFPVDSASASKAARMRVWGRAPTTQ